MTSTNNDDSYNENTCVVCFKNVEIFSIGDCDHPVCYECSTRMRVLCRQNECPICRHDMQKVIFTRTVQPFKELDKSIGTKNLMIDRKFKIVFESTTIQHAYNTLLAHVCSVCPGRHAFQTYNNLRDHMRKEHELFYCDLCVENLKILTHERRCYTRKELAMHRRQGDPDNRSHRGHPLCEFCDRRYMDNDELYRHLRRDHLFCHFCDADGLHQYYDSYEVLRNHFRDQHYLCEEGDCYDEKFTSAFRTEIDLKAHRASVHGRQMSKAAAKQARTLELAFTLKPRPRPHQDRHRPQSRYNQQSDEEEGAVGGAAPERHRHFQPPQPQPQAVAKQRINTASNDEFPTLGGGNAPLTAHGVHFRKPGVSVRTGKSLAMTEEDFPALASDGPSQSLSVRLSKGVSIHVNSRPGQVTTTVSTASGRDPFPALGNKAPSRPSSSQPQWSAVRQSEPKSKPAPPPSRPTQPKSFKTLHYDDDFPSQNNFPALGGNVPSHIANLAATQWSSGREPEAKFSVNKNKPNQPPPPKPPQPKTFHIEDDFPSLNSRFDASCSFTPEPRSAEAKSLPEAKVKKESSISIPVDNDWNKSVRGAASADNISSDSDIGSKKGSKKKNNKSKTKKDPQSEATKPSPVKNNNNEPSKKNKQKDEPKAKTKQIKVEEKKEVMKENAVEKKRPQEAERKRSELKIENLNGQSSSESSVNGNNNINMNDFPSLGNNRLPPGFGSTVVKEKPASAPPGFESSGSAPPGFNITLNSVARPTNGLTFTSSSGHNYPIPSGDGRVFSYVAPPSVKSRNTSLVSRVTEALGTQPALDEFLQMSALYRQGSLTAEAYYKHCRTAMGADAFKHVFPELLVLLPDIEKQQALWKVAERPKEWKLNVCAACGQVVSAADFRHHHTTHSLENHFPALSNGAQPASSAWTSK